MRPLVLLLAAAALPAQGAAVKLPPYSREVWPNGVVLYLLPKHETPLVDLRVVVRGGGEADPPGMAGLSLATAASLRSGTESRTAAQFTAELDRMGARLSASATRERSAVTLEVLAKFAGPSAALLADAVLHATFPDDEVRRRLERWSDASRAGKDSLSAAASDYFPTFFFGSNHPYGRPLDGDQESLGRIGSQAIANYHAAMYGGANLVLIAAGDFDPARMRVLLRENFGRLPAGRRWAGPAHVSARPCGARLLLVDKPDATGAQVLIGLPGIRRSARGRIPLLLANTAFGGAYTSILNEELRVKAGLTYGASSTVGEDRLAGSITISTSTSTDRVTQVLDTTLRLLKTFSAHGLTESQLEGAKRYFKGVYPPDNIQTAEQLAVLLGDLEVLGLGRDEIDGLYGRIDAVTLKEANAAARKYFRPANPRIVLAGDAARLRGKVAAYAPVVEISVAAAGFGLPPACRH